MVRALIVGLPFVLGMATSANAQVTYTFTTISLPGSTSTWTLSGGINDLGQIAGDYTGANPGNHGFLQSAAGAYSTIDVPGSTSTQILGLNDAGHTVGLWYVLATPVPEPGSLLLLGAASIGAIAVRRWRARRPLDLDSHALC